MYRYKCHPRSEAFSHHRSFEYPTRSSNHPHLGLGTEKTSRRSLFTLKYPIILDQKISGCQIHLRVASPKRKLHQHNKYYRQCEHVGDTHSHDGHRRWPIFAISVRDVYHAAEWSIFKDQIRYIIANATAKTPDLHIVRLGDMTFFKDPSPLRSYCNPSELIMD